MNKQVVWGPLSFATAVSIARRGTLRHPLQIIVSVAHLYGVALYFSTSFIEERFRGVAYSRPEAQYFWVYYVGFNAPWVIIPAGECLTFSLAIVHGGYLLTTTAQGIIVYSIRNINRSTSAFDKVAASLDKKKDRLKAAFA